MAAKTREIRKYRWKMPKIIEFWVYIYQISVSLPQSRIFTKHITGNSQICEQNGHQKAPNLKFLEYRSKNKYYFWFFCIEIVVHIHDARVFRNIIYYKLTHEQNGPQMAANSQNSNLKKWNGILQIFMIPLAIDHFNVSDSYHVEVGTHQEFSSSSFCFFYVFLKLWFVFFLVVFFVFFLSFCFFFRSNEFELFIEKIKSLCLVLHISFCCIW